MNENKEIVKVESVPEEDIFGQMDELNKHYEEKFLKEIHPLIKKFHDKTGKHFKFEIPDKVIIDWNGSYYWCVDGSIHAFPISSNIWWEKEGCDIYGRKFGGERNGDFYMISRLCSKYYENIKEQIKFNLKEMMK